MTSARQSHVASMTAVAAQQTQGARRGPPKLILGSLAGGAALALVIHRQLARRRSKVEVQHGTLPGERIAEAAAPLLPEEPTQDTSLTACRAGEAFEDQQQQQQAGAAAGEPLGVVVVPAESTNSSPAQLLQQPVSSVEPSSSMPSQPVQEQATAPAGSAGNQAVQEKAPATPGSSSNKDSERLLLPEGLKESRNEAGEAPGLGAATKEGATAAPKQGAGAAEPAVTAAQEREQGQEEGFGRPAAQLQQSAKEPMQAGAVQSGSKAQPAAQAQPGGKGAAGAGSQAAAALSKKEGGRQPREGSSEEDGGAFDFSEFLIKAVVGAVAPPPVERPSPLPQETTSSKLLRRAFGRGTRKLARGIKPAGRA